MQNMEKLLDFDYHKSGLMRESKRLKNSLRVLCRIHSKSIINTLYTIKPHQSHHLFFLLSNPLFNYVSIMIANKYYSAKKK